MDASVAKPWYAHLWFIPFLCLWVWVIGLKVAFQPLHYTTVDGTYYSQLADRIREGKSFVLDDLRNQTGRSFSPYPPGYPALLAAAGSVTGLSYARAAPILHVFLLGLLALFWRKYAPLWPLALAFCVDHSLELATYPWSECTFTMLLVAFALARTKGNKFLEFLTTASSFLVRFAGISALVVWGVSRIRQKWKPTGNSVKSEFGLMIGFAVWVAFYFCFEWLWYGQLTGGDRYPNSETHWVLFRQLKTELLNQVLLFRDFTGTSAWSFRLGLGVQLALILALFTGQRRTESIHSATVLSRHLLTIGLSYWAFIIPVRWYFYFAEPFDFRLLGPGGILLWLSLFTVYSARYRFRFPKITIGISLALALFLSLPRKEILMHYQEWLWLQKVKPSPKGRIGLIYYAGTGCQQGEN